MLSFIKEISVFLFRRKKFWLAPILLMLVLLGGLAMFAEAASVSPFVYTVF
jgi:hypothetical protein